MAMSLPSVGLAELQVLKQADSERFISHDGVFYAVFFFNLHKRTSISAASTTFTVDRSYRRTTPTFGVYEW